MVLEDFGETKMPCGRACSTIFSGNLPEEKEKAFLSSDVLADQEQNYASRTANSRKMAPLGSGLLCITTIAKIKAGWNGRGLCSLEEWLAGQPRRMKRKISAGIPLLPFSILIEANQVNTVRHIVRHGKEWTCDVPLLFLVKRELLQEKDWRRFVPLWEDGLFLFRPAGLKVYTSGEAFQELKSRLQEKVKAKEVELQEEINRERTFIGLQERVSSFFRQYPDEQVKGWEEQRLRLNAECASLEGQIESSEKQRKEWKEELSGFEIPQQYTKKRKLKGIIAKLAASAVFIPER